MRTILAIDQSTSATKALLFAETGELLDKTAVSHQQLYPRPGWVEHDAEKIYRNMLEAVANLLARNEVDLSNLSGVSVTNQRETFVVFDKAGGEPLYNAIVWQCRRGENICQATGRRGTRDACTAAHRTEDRHLFSGVQDALAAGGPTGYRQKNGCRRSICGYYRRLPDLSPHQGTRFCHRPDECLAHASL